VTAIQGDACDVPQQLRGERFALVYSNSLLEHVGGHVERKILADNIHLFADRHWVQTPYRYFQWSHTGYFPDFSGCLIVRVSRCRYIGIAATFGRIRGQRLKTRSTRLT
jgi:hypothetical protein